MKKITTLYIFLLSFVSVNAQWAPEEMDSLAVEIAQIEKMTEGLYYRDGNGEKYQLSFSAEPFTLWYHDKLASKAVYKKYGEKEILYLTENIDFKKATGISVSEVYEGVRCIEVDFPKGYLKTQLFENGNPVGNISEDFLEFYCPATAANSKGQKFFEFQFINLVLLPKKLQSGQVGTGINTNPEIDAWYHDKTNFKAKFPNSLINAETDRKKEEMKKLAPQIDYINYLTERFGLKKGLTVDEYIAFNPSSASLLNKRGKESNGNTIYSKIKGIGNPYPAGPLVATVSAGYEVMHYSHVIFSGKNEGITKEIDTFLEDVFANIEKKYITISGSYITIDVPKAPMKFSFNRYKYNSWEALDISF